MALIEFLIGSQCEVVDSDDVQPYLIPIFAMTTGMGFFYQSLYNLLLLKSKCWNKIKLKPQKCEMFNNYYSCFCLFKAAFDSNNWNPSSKLSDVLLMNRLPIDRKNRSTAGLLGILRHIKNMETKSSTQMGAFFSPDVWQLRSRQYGHFLFTVGIFDIVGK